MYQLYVTPTGMYLDGPYLDKSNRVMRQYKEYSSHFLHVSFVEEDGTQISHSNVLADIPHTVIYEDRFAGFFKEGIRIAGRLFKFLAFSNSSLKEGRVLFFHEPTDGAVTCESIRAWMGDFSMIKSPARYAARMGQAFTSTASTVKVNSKEVVMSVPDVERNGYNFSDGVGTISQEIANDIWAELQKLNKGIARNKVSVGRNEALLDLVPSAFQIRFGGAKGMVSVDPSLQGRKMKIRKSMIKFNAPNSTIIEIADDSSVCREAYFNRQVILILEDMGVGKQVFLDLQRKAVRELAVMWNNPEKLAELAGKDGAFGNFVRLWENLGIFQWTNNDFIRQSFEHIRAYLLKEIKYRARIKIPGGWTLFGVLDETGTLKEGQIFVQLSSPAVSKIIAGPVLIYRSPCIHPGDIQPAIAVNCPQLHHMRNVVVFSQFGKRDLPSKLGGGDLDGDMFSIIENRAFFPHPSAFRAAAEYTATKPIELDHPVTMDDIADFILFYMQHDKLGIIARRHLALADQVDGGSTHPDCLLLSNLY
ncbi:RNA-dependent RNA polymerase [Obelidium mucronatum]|nr:RNA-dependent RNA polymerase [Obelidium mucronatum]